MATSQGYIEFVAEQLAFLGNVRYKKMFGEYMVYIDDKPLVLVCDETPFVKKLPCLDVLMTAADCGFPYNGAKEHYILDVEDKELTKRVIGELGKVTPVPKPKAKKPKEPKKQVLTTDADVIISYIEAQREDIQPLLRQVYNAIRAALPDSVEKISWGMPTFWQSRNLIHFAAQKNHLGIYPGPAAVAHFAPQLANYKTSKGGIQFPYKTFGAEELEHISEIAAWIAESALR